MSEFMDEAKNLADKDPSLANKGLDEATQMAGDKAGGKFDSQIQEGEQKAEGFLGTDQGGQDPNQGGQDPNQGGQDPNQGGQDPNQ